MLFHSTKYCIDANVLIQAWQKYYSPNLCHDYWDVLDSLGNEGRIFLPQMVFEEIARVEDDLAQWVKASKIPVRAIDSAVTKRLREVYDINPLHKYLVDNIKQRSLADPWVIAHALVENASVVTKEEKATAINTRRIKIPNVCENMGIDWMDDFQMIKNLNIRFKCAIDN